MTVTNRFYERLATLVAGNTANATDVEDKLARVQSAFDLAEAELNVCIQFTADDFTGGQALLASDAATRALKALGFDANGDPTLYANAQEWAIKTDGAVEGGEYSAKYHAQAAQTAAEAAQTAAETAETAETNAETAQANAEAAETNAASAQGYAEEWANKAEDSLVSVAAGGDGATEYSSRHWAAKAASRHITTNTTITVAASGADYTTVGAAYASLADKIIAAGVTVTLAVAAGTYSETTIRIDHPQSDKIKIVGAGSASTTLNLVSGDRLFYVLNGTTSVDVTGLTAVNATGGNAYGVLCYHEGRFQSTGDLILQGFTTAVFLQHSSSAYLVGTIIRDSTDFGIYAFEGSTVTGSSITIESASVEMTYYPIYALGGSAISISTITISQDSVRHLVYVIDSTIAMKYATLSGDVSAAGSALARADNGAMLALYAADISGSAYAALLAINDSHIAIEGWATISGSYTSAVMAHYGSTIDAYTLQITGSCVYGFLCQYDSMIRAASASVSGATHYGMYVSDGSAVHASGAAVSNAATGISAYTGSYIHAVSSTVTGATTDYSPAANTEGNVLSYIAK